MDIDNIEKIVENKFKQLATLFKTRKRVQSTDVVHATLPIELLAYVDVIADELACNRSQAVKHMILKYSRNAGIYDKLKDLKEKYNPLNK